MYTTSYTRTVARLKCTQFIAGSEVMLDLFFGDEVGGHSSVYHISTLQTVTWMEIYITCAVTCFINSQNLVQLIFIHV